MLAGLFSVYVYTSCTRHKFNPLLVVAFLDNNVTKGVYDNYNGGAS